MHASPLSHLAVEAAHELDQEDATVSTKRSPISNNRQDVNTRTSSKITIARYMGFTKESSVVIDEAVNDEERE